MSYFNFFLSNKVNLVVAENKEKKSIDLSPKTITSAIAGGLLLVGGGSAGGIFFDNNSERKSEIIILRETINELEDEIDELKFEVRLLKENR